MAEFMKKLKKAIIEVWQGIKKTVKRLLETIKKKRQAEKVFKPPMPSNNSMYIKPLASQVIDRKPHFTRLRNKR